MAIARRPPILAGRIHYAWVMAAVTFVVLIGASGFRSAPGVLIVPLEGQFGWDRATISRAVAINLVLFGFMGPFAAAMMNRWRIRPVLSVALVTVALGSALTTLMTQPWQLYLTWGVLVGLGTGASATVLSATVANRWFLARRGLVTGLLTAAGATGQLAFLPGLAFLADHVGWRAVALTVAGSALLVVALVVTLMRSTPADVGLRRYGATEDEPEAGSTANPIATAFGTLRGVAGHRDFWLLAGTFFVCGATTSGLIGTHLIPAGHDHGLSEITAANLLALIGVFDIVGTLASGWLTDRYDPRRLLFTYYALRGLSLLLLPGVLGAPNAGLILFIVFYGLDWVATVPPTIALITRSFGLQRSSVIYGWVFAAHQLGAAAAAYAAGVVRTVSGDYAMAFIAAGWLALGAALLVFGIGRVGSRGVPVRPVAAEPDSAAAG